MIPINLAGKTALITGATGELGRAITKQLASAGANVVINYHKNEKQANLLKNQILNIGPKAIIVQADITNEESVNLMKEKINKELSAPDIVIVNALKKHKWESILNEDIANFESQYRSSMVQAVLISKAFIPSMKKRKWGRIIGLNSECSMLCWENQAAYVAGKRGMDGIFRVLSKEVGKYNITVNQVAPGWTISKNSSKSKKDFDYSKNVPLRHRGKDVDIANAIIFLASDLADFITGIYLPVCGGHVIPGI